MYLYRLSFFLFPLLIVLRHDAFFSFPEQTHGSCSPFDILLSLQFPLILTKSNCLFLLFFFFFFNSIFNVRIRNCFLFYYFVRLSVSNSSSSATFASFFYYLSELQKKKTHTHTCIYIYIYMLVFIKLQCDRFCQQFYVMLREERKEKKKVH